MPDAWPVPPAASVAQLRHKDHCVAHFRLGPTSRAGSSRVSGACKADNSWVGAGTFAVTDAGHLSWGVWILAVSQESKPPVAAVCPSRNSSSLSSSCCGGRNPSRCLSPPNVPAGAPGVSHGGEAGLLFCGTLTVRRRHPGTPSGKRLVSAHRGQSLRVCQGAA